MDQRIDSTSTTSSDSDTAQMQAGSGNIRDLPRLPERIVRLTEESVELLYMLGQQHRISGISVYVVRPERARKEKPMDPDSPFAVLAALKGGMTDEKKSDKADDEASPEKAS